MHECIIIVSDDVVQRKQTTVKELRHTDVRSDDVNQQRVPEPDAGEHQAKVDWWLRS